MLTNQCNHFHINGVYTRYVATSPDILLFWPMSIKSGKKKQNMFHYNPPPPIITGKL